jgi:hypothetical protein
MSPLSSILDVFSESLVIPDQLAWLLGASEIGQNATSWAHRNSNTAYHGYLITFSDFQTQADVILARLFCHCQKLRDGPWLSLMG